MKSHRVLKIFIGSMFGIALFASLFLVRFFNEQSKHIYSSIDSVRDGRIVIVFGAGLKRDGTPSDMLNDRLKVAVSLYEAGIAKRILVSGDNRFASYNEPEVMKETLIRYGVRPQVVVTDYAGRRTYDTCVRAKTLWGVDKALLVTQGYHLHRAIWTCQQLGIDSSGLSASLQSYLGIKWFKLRELAAIFRALFDVYIKTPSYVSGEAETDLYYDSAVSTPTFHHPTIFVADSIIEVGEIEFLNEKIRHNPSDSNLYFRRAMAYKRLLMYQMLRSDMEDMHLLPEWKAQAMADFDFVIEHDSKNTQAIEERAFLLEK